MPAINTTTQNDLKTFNYDQAKSIMGKILSEAENINRIFNKCNNIIDENVCVESRWSGAKASAFKEKWQNTSVNFKDFYNMIVDYATLLNVASTEHEKYEIG